MKKVLFLLLAIFLVLAACGNEESKNEDKKEAKASDKESKKDDKESNDSKENKSESKEEEDVATQDTQSQQQSTEEPSQSQETKPENKQVQLSNITDRSTLETVIYGNYSEQQKIQAYNSAVANGVIPQGNVMEGPASAAYESSLRVESGEDESIYEKNGKGTDAHASDEMEEFYQQERADEQAEKDAQAAKEEELHNEYNALTEEMYGEDSDLSDEEIDKLEEKQDAILDQVEPIN